MRHSRRTPPDVDAWRGQLGAIRAGREHIRDVGRLADELHDGQLAAMLQGADLRLHAHERSVDAALGMATAGNRAALALDLADELLDSTVADDVLDDVRELRREIRHDMVGHCAAPTEATGGDADQRRRRQADVNETYAARRDARKRGREPSPRCGRALQNCGSAACDGRQRGRGGVETDERPVSGQRGRSS